MKEPSWLDMVVESIYYQASVREQKMVSEGGVPVDDRWWSAIEEAYREGHASALRGETLPPKT